MSGIVALILIAAAPAVFTLLLRSNAAFVFLALCEGAIINETLGDDAISALHTFFPRTNSIQESTLHLILLLLPVILTIIFLRGQMYGAKTMLNVAPAILTGLALSLLVVPLLPGGVKADIMSTQTWKTMDQFRGVIIGSGSIITLMLLWTGHKNKKRKHGGRHHKG